MSKKIAVSFNPKIETALYFDFAACFHCDHSGIGLEPLASNFFRLDEDIDENEMDYITDYEKLGIDSSQFLKQVKKDVGLETYKILPEDSRPDKREILEGFNGRTNEYIEGFLTEPFKDYSTSSIEIHAKNLIVHSMTKLLCRRGVIATPFYEEVSTNDTSIASSLNLGSKKTGTDALEICLHKVPMIDYSDLEWGKVMELRSDDSFKNALWKLKRFIKNIPADSTRDDIVKEINNRIYEVERKLEKNGVKSRKGIYSVILNSRSLPLAALGVMATITGIPLDELLTANQAAGIGAVVATAAMYDLVNILISVEPTNVQKDGIIQDSEVEYLFMIKDLK